MKGIGEREEMEGGAVIVGTEACDCSRRIEARQIDCWDAAEIEATDAVESREIVDEIIFPARLSLKKREENNDELVREKSARWKRQGVSERGREKGERTSRGRWLLRRHQE